MIRTTLAALIASALLAACAVSSESVDSSAEELSAPPGSGGCERGEHVCFAWHGSEQITGQCTVAGTCCTGCIDSRGTCQAGTLNTVCGNAGGACASCNDGLECTNDACNPNGTCYHANKVNSTTCDFGKGHCDLKSGECCDGVFALVPGDGGVEFACVSTCPSCTCFDARDNLCLPAAGAPGDCACL